jgi:transcriptional regulator with XRE-family HTH domain
MTQRRQGLSQRRKAVGLTQEALAQRLGVERSTVVRWEAGDTEPLPSIRPDLARALRVSIDQLVELLTTAGNADTAQALPVSTEVTTPVPLPEVQPVERPGRAGFENLIRSQVAEAIKVLRRRRARSRRFTPFAAAGILTVVLTGGALSVEFLIAHSDPISPAGQSPAIPLAAIPVPNPGNSPHSNPVNGPSSEDPAAASHPAPATTPGAPADGPVSPEAAPRTSPVLTPHTIRSSSLPKSPAAARTPTPPRTPAIPAEAAAWPQAAGLSASDPRRTRLHHVTSTKPPAEAESDGPE